MTRQRAAVRQELAREPAFRSAQEIYARLRSGGDRVGLTTVYRALQSMVDAGEVDMLRTDDGESAYRLCSEGHHHHLVCRSCGLTVEVEDRAVERWARRVADQHGFTGVEHTVEVFGTCTRCAR
jgi:Fur family transcriptional regulator, ferric uptake regulator